MGKPTPRTMWYHNNQPVKESREIIIYQDANGVCKLSINEVFPEDEGLYTCVASNAIGEAVCATSLVVEGNMKHIPHSFCHQATNFVKHLSH